MESAINVSLKEYGHNIISRRAYQEYKLLPVEVPVLPPAFEKPPVPQKGSTTQALFT